MRACERADEGGQHEGHEEEQLHRPLEGQVGARDQPGEERADDRAGDGDAAGKNQRVEQGLVGFLFFQDLRDVGQVELAVDPEGVEKDQQHREGDDDEQNADGQREQ